MATTPESKVKAKLSAKLNKLGAYHFSPATHGYGRSGVPDIVGCYKGWFFGLECKAGKNKPTALQMRELEAIRAAGGFSLVVNEETIDGAIAVLQILKDRGT